MPYLLIGLLAGIALCLLGYGIADGASRAERKLEDLQAGIDTNNNGEKE